MNNLAQHKIALIAWIANLQDISLLQRLLQLQNQQNSHVLSKTSTSKRKAGWGKKWITYIS